MASITTWTKLETRQRTTDLDVSLAARVNDPLWLLARQWQMGEFRGRDSGRPVSVRLTASTGRLDRYHPGPITGAPPSPSGGHGTPSSPSGEHGTPPSSSGGHGTPSSPSGEHGTPPSSSGGPGAPPQGAGRTSARPFDDATLPLEARVEAEVLTYATAPRLAIDAGAHYLRLLKAEDLDRYRQAFVSAFPIGNRPDPDRDPAGAAFHDLVSTRVPDGFSLGEALRPSGGHTIPDGVAVDPEDVDAVVQVNRRWLIWLATIVTPAPEDSAWVADRLEYAFAVSSTVGGSEHVLVAPEYSSGRLDWHDFDVRSGVSLGSTEDERLVVRTVLPAAVSYPGMPVARWWEFEDAQVDLGAIGAGADDIARMLLVGFAVDYGNDWFVVPVDLPVGSLTAIRSMVVTDTFGVRTRVRSSRAVDGDGAAWRMFGFSDTAGADVVGGDTAGRGADLLLVAPVLASSLDGPTREKVAIARDELANLVWAVEDVVESATGLPRRRDEEPRPRRRQDEVSAGITYEVATGVAPHWHPLVVVTDAVGAARLEQRELQPALGTILGAGNQLRLAEEEIPGEGLGLARSFQVARWMDGRTILWSSLQRTAGRGPTSSGLQFDSIHPRPLSD